REETGQPVVILCLVAECDVDGRDCAVCCTKRTFSIRVCDAARQFLCVVRVDWAATFAAPGRCDAGLCETGVGAAEHVRVFSAPFAGRYWRGGDHAVLEEKVLEAVAGLWCEPEAFIDGCCRREFCADFRQVTVLGRR